MFYRIAIITLACCCAGGSLFGAQNLGSASGKGTIERIVAFASGGSELLGISPRYSYAYSEGKGAKKNHVDCPYREGAPGESLGVSRGSCRGAAALVRDGEEVVRR